MSLLKKYLTDDERLLCWRAGSAQKIASMGLTQLDAASIILSDPADTAGERGIEKRGQLSELAHVISPYSVAKTIFAVSLITGIPVGIVAHEFGRRKNKITNEERKLETEADYYRAATDQLENGMRAYGM